MNCFGVHSQSYGVLVTSLCTCGRELEELKTANITLRNSDAIWIAAASRSLNHVGVSSEMLKQVRGSVNGDVNTLV